LNILQNSKNQNVIYLKRRGSSALKRPIIPRKSVMHFGWEEEAQLTRVAYFYMGYGFLLFKCILYIGNRYYKLIVIVQN